MKAVVKTKLGFGNIELMEVPEPHCASDSVKIEVKYAGICGTDLHIYHDTYKSNPPVIIGHEFSGIVTDIGDKVKNIKKGDRVTVLPSTAITCGVCEFCKSGNYMFCNERKSLGSGTDGGFTKYVIAREDMVYRIPDHVTLEEAALTEPLACAVQATEELTTINVGDTVLLSGPGPIGLLCLTMLVLKGCKVIVAGTGADSVRLDIAKKLGADVIVNVSNEDLKEIIIRETNGSGVDVVVECSGAPASISSCLYALKKMGKYIQVGIVGKEITVDFDTVLYKQIQLFGSLAHSKKTWERVGKILEQRKINIAPVITHKIPLRDWKEAFEICESKLGGKVLLTYDE
ncbi:Zn-dependent alcohol dehydrogenase [Paenibacillus alginolyticus]|nr:Zn-dependent alcohol dehydrogenase [Paenibacillus alginolyticus]MCY9665806.1 Zn-dependent alcohol dehydrogenase [Paenibacillus alginolyticus]